MGKPPFLLLPSRIAFSLKNYIKLLLIYFANVLIIRFFSAAFSLAVKGRTLQTYCFMPLSTLLNVCSFLSVIFISFYYDAGKGVMYS